MLRVCTEAANRSVCGRSDVLIEFRECSVTLAQRPRSSSQKSSPQMNERSHIFEAGHEAVLPTIQAAPQRLCLRGGGSPDATFRAAAATNLGAEVCGYASSAMCHMEPPACVAAVARRMTGAVAPSRNLAGATSACPWLV